MERQYIGRYRITGQLGTGSMGAVMRAVDEVRHRDVAITVPQDLNPAVISRLQKECDLLTQLQHPQIAQVFGAGSDPDLAFYIVREYIDGATLEDLLRQQGGRLEPGQALKIALGVAEALAYAHKLRILHGDLTPGALLIRTSDGVVKVADFGIAAILTEQSGRSANNTSAYRAPEQASGKGVDARADLYALGVILYEMLTGARPSRPAASLASAPDMAALPPEALARLDRLTVGLLARDPKQRRPQRAREVAEAVRAIAQALPASDTQAPASASAHATTQRPGAPSGASATPDYTAYLAPPSMPVPPPLARPAIQAAPQVVIMPQRRFGRARVAQVGPMVRAAPGRRVSGLAPAALALGLSALLFACPEVGVNLLSKVGGNLFSSVENPLLIAGGVLAVLAVVCGHLALIGMRRSAARVVGQGAAIVGLSAGYLGLGLTLIVFFAHNQLL